jgi:anti-sigma B factor antagonist
VYIDDFHLTLATVAPELALVSMSGELDLYTAERVQGGIDEAVAVGADTVVVDLSGISFVDSTALGVLVQETRRLEGRGHSLVLVTSDPRTQRVLEVTGLDRVLRTYATLHDALAELLPGAPPAAAEAG